MVLYDSVPDLIFNRIPYHNQTWNIALNEYVTSSGKVMWHKYVENKKDASGKIIQGEIRDFDTTKLVLPTEPQREPGQRVERLDSEF